MDLIDTIDITFADLAATVDHKSLQAAERVPAPGDALVRRIGAINAEAVRQTGRVAVTTVDALRGVTTVALTGVSELAEATAAATGDSADAVRTTGRRAVGDVKQATSTIRNRAGRAVQQVERNFRVVGNRAERIGERVERKAGKAADDVVRSADTATAKTSARGASTPRTSARGASASSGAYERWTKDELYERAQELDIDGRSQMSKRQLIQALRDAS